MQGRIARAAGSGLYRAYTMFTIEIYTSSHLQRAHLAVTSENLYDLQTWPVLSRRSPDLKKISPLKYRTNQLVRFTTRSSRYPFDHRSACETLSRILMSWSCVSVFMLSLPLLCLYTNTLNSATGLRDPVLSDYSQNTSRKLSIPRIEMCASGLGSFYSLSLVA